MNTATLADAQLAALAYLEAFDDQNGSNAVAVLATTTDVDMVIGLLGLVHALRASLVSAAGLTIPDVNRLLRAHLLDAAGGAA